MNKEIIQIQLALFFKNDFIGSFEEIVFKIKKVLGEGEITNYFPVPVSAPSEIPRLVISYEQFNLNFSKNRLDLYINPSIKIEARVDLIGKIGKILLEDLGLSMGRIGYVKKFFVETNLEEMKKLINKQVNDLEELSIRVNKKDVVDEFECNNIENLVFGIVTKKEVDKEITRTGMIIDRDINTLAENVASTFLNLEKIKNLVITLDNKSEIFILLD